MVSRFKTCYCNKTKLSTNNSNERLIRYLQRTIKKTERENYYNKQIIKNQQKYINVLFDYSLDSYNYSIDSYNQNNILNHIIENLQNN
jgi:hypothetical protein